MKQLFRFLQVLVLVLLWGGASAQYCTPTYSTGCTYGDGLTLFQLNTINQTIPCSGTPAWYHDYTAVTTTLVQGTNYNLTMTAGYSSTYVTIWIDYNNNNAFDANEVVLNGYNCVNANVPYTTTINLPTTTQTGSHRMRYRTNWLSAPTGPCTTMTYGNSCDFTVVVQAPAIGNLTGTVRNSYNNNPIANATVSVSNKVGTTNASGVYTITGIGIGTYTATCTATNFLPGSASVTISTNQTTTQNFFLDPMPAFLSGIVTNASTGAPVTGAAVTVNGKTTYSLEGGTYSLNVFPFGNFPVTAVKPGFENYTTAPTTINFQQGQTYEQNIELQEAANPPGPVTAVLNGTQTAVTVSWVAPTGSYEIIYDDGVAEN
ncbi:MAG: hypothetical protein FJY10_07450, partial [Bacteroidetes bacterium]|nr:hypothetical protein [Bacteroidota bacterium]